MSVKTDINTKKGEKKDMKLKRVVSFLKRLWIRIRLYVYVATAFAMTLVKVGYCSDTTDISSTVLDWMPVILQFAMLGMMMGLLKKLGKW